MKAAIEDTEEGIVAIEIFCCYSSVCLIVALNEGMKTIYGVQMENSTFLRLHAYNRTSFHNRPERLISFLSVREK